MANSDVIISNLDNIFSGNLSLETFYRNYGSGNEDRNIEPWDSESSTMVVRGSGSKVVLKPRIKSKQEREHLAKETEKFYNKNSEEIQQKIIEYLNPETPVSFSAEVSKRGDSGSSVNFFNLRVFKEGKESGNPILSILFQAKGLSNGEGGKRSDPHELMTACLILEMNKINVNQLNNKKGEKHDEEIKKIVDKLAATSSKVQGSAGLDGFYIDRNKEDPDVVNLAKAISVSNYIIDEIGPGKVQTVWQTGTKWASEVKKFNVGPKTIKNYNSSDIIVKFNINKSTHYWGLSLKKRGITGGTPDVEPTLLNKPLMGSRGFIERKLKSMNGGPAAIKKIEDAKLKFFRGAIKAKTKNVNYKNKPIDKMPIKEVLKAVDTLFTERNDKSSMLRGQGEYAQNPNIYFKAIDEVFMKNFNNNKEFFEEFMDLIFKIKLDSYLTDTNFHFSLVTGTGDYKNGKIMEVHPPLEKEGRLTSEIFKKLFGAPHKDSFKIIQQDNRKHAFEPGATAAKLFYTMLIGKKNPIAIVDLEVRYKGALTSEPQFQVFMSVRQNNFSQLYKKLAAKKTFGPDRWK
jgi:hypothetical protein|tara:strand:- start:51 stop:1763 length:1713 start_codon:yes stop_codon:yes gene_type:complete